jgi:hypothetical protein
VFDDGNDYELFLSEVCDRLHLRVNAVHIQTRLSDYPSQIPLDRIQELGFDGFLMSVIQAPTNVLVALCDQFKIHLQASAFLYF